MSNNSTTLYRAPFVVPVDQPLIENGAVLVRKGEIIKVGRYADLTSEVSSAQVVDLEGSVITPALINCHAHLELSWMAEMGRADDYFNKGDITDWINTLLTKRETTKVSDEEIANAAKDALATMQQSGVALVADIGNDEVSSVVGQDQQVAVLFFLELMGLTKQSVEFAEQRMETLQDLFCTAHGPYSVHPDLLQRLKSVANEKKQLFPIHTAESADEMEFLRTGKGRFKEFLERRLHQAGLLKGVFADVFSAPGCGAIEYLDTLGILDPQTICVHAVHVSEAEAATLAAKQVKVCLCPASNRFLGVGKAPVLMYLQHGILPGLGTDSLASNNQLSIWNEMKVLQEENSGLSPELIFKMASLGGAQTLSSEKVYGSLTAGKRASMLAITHESIKEADIYESLVSFGDQVELQWLEG